MHYTDGTASKRSTMIFIRGPFSQPHERRLLYVQCPTVNVNSAVCRRAIIQQLGDQPQPQPQQLMIVFTCLHAEHLFLVMTSPVCTRAAAAA